MPGKCSGSTTLMYMMYILYLRLGVYVLNTSCANPTYGWSLECLARPQKLTLRVIPNDVPRLPPQTIIMVILTLSIMVILTLG